MITLVPTGPGDILDLIRHGRATTRGDVLERDRAVTDDGRPASRRAARGRHGRRGRDRRGHRRTTAAQPGLQHLPVPRAHRRRRHHAHPARRHRPAAARCSATPRSTYRSKRGPRWCWTRSRRRCRRCSTSRTSAPHDLCGLGLSLPGPVDPESGRPSQPPILPGWDAYPVAEHLQATLPGVTVLTANDADAAALGEYAAGHGGVRSLVPGQGLDRHRHRHRDRRPPLHRRRRRRRRHRPRPGLPRSEALCQCGMQGCLAAVASGRAVAAELTALGVPAVVRSRGRRAAPRRQRRRCAPHPAGRAPDRRGDGHRGLPAEPRGGPDRRGAGLGAPARRHPRDALPARPFRGRPDTSTCSSAPWARTPPWSG